MAARTPTTEQHTTNLPVTLESTGGDVAAALDHATKAAVTVTERPIGSAADTVLIVDRHADRQTDTIDLEPLLPAPRRNRGTTQLHTPDGLISYVKHADPAAFEIYANLHTFALTAVLNPAVDDQPAWQDWRGHLQVTRHPVWEEWRKIDGELLPQAAFAEFIQEHASQLQHPAALDMLEIAETLTLNVGARVSSAVRLRDGQRHIVFDEKVEATAGYERDVTIPELLLLRLPLFEGTEPTQVDARLLYRARGGEVGFAIRIIDRTDLERRAFAELVTGVAQALDVEPIHGAPPAA